MHKTAVGPLPPCPERWPLDIGLRRENRHAPAPSAFGTLDEYLLAILRHVDRYQHAAAGCRIELGHGPSVLKVLSR
jgi:hypothetical protein